MQLIGADTQGKPSGFLATQLCDQTVFANNVTAINVTAINVTSKDSEGTGDDYDGLPVNCAAEDTLVGDWGQPNAPMLTEAQYLLESGQCSESGQSFKKLKNKGKFSFPSQKVTIFD